MAGSQRTGGNSLNLPRSGCRHTKGSNCHRGSSLTVDIHVGLIGLDVSLELGRDTLPVGLNALCSARS